jgi:hypothetical protein
MEESYYEEPDCYVIETILLPWRSASKPDKIKRDRDVVRFMY